MRNDFLETVEKFKKEVKDMKTELMVMAVDSGSLQNMNTSEFETIKNMLNLLDTSMKLTTQQAKTLIDIDQKIDKLLEK